MFRFLIICFILFTSIPAKAERTFVTRNPYFNRYQAIQPYNYNFRNTNLFNDIGDIELYIFDKVYCNENNLSRLQRIEQAVFGAVQQGDIYQRYENAKNAVFSRPKQNYKTSLLKNLSDYFVGQMTGYTPSVYPSMYGNSSFGNYSGPYGYREGYRNYTNSSNSSIRIID